ncbi:MAG: riboflavin synthase [Candidatus Dormibacteraeota bacterium]|nr:riboflavin synthase [Candidatus Dormibacteraeota bacterium]
MFSGIVSAGGTVAGASGGGISVKAPGIAGSLRPGDSVAVNGVCLTVTSTDADGFSADVMPETRRVTTIGALQPGDSVNLEPALRFGDTVGGHLVSGHVDGVGTVRALREDENARWATIDVASDLLPLIVEKGAITVDGISLTVVDVFDAAFTVSLIPHTLAVTVAGSWRPGSRVNVEVDMLARYVHRALALQERTAEPLPQEV